MAVPVVKWDQSTAASRLRKRRRWRIAGLAIAAIILTSILADHLRAQNRRGDDWLRFDAHPMQFVTAIDGSSIAVRDETTEDVTVVALLGIKPPNADWNGKSDEHIEAMLAGKKLTLHLRNISSRDSRGRLLADVFLDNRELLSANLAAEGLVVADRRSGGDFFNAIERAQSTARKKHLGVWATGS